MGNYVVIESFVKGKSEAIPCEDRIVITPYYCAVIDGVTSKTPMNIQDQTPGFWAAELIEQAIINLPYDCYNEVWLIGDCQCRINGITYKNEKLVDRIFSKVRSYVNRTELLKGKTVAELQEKDIGREYIFPLLRKQVIWQNSEVDSLYSYPVLDGFPVLLSKVRVISVPKYSQVVLASDGYPVLYDDLRETEKALFDILERDPLCIEEYLSTKGVARLNDSFDDRAYLRLQL